MSKTAKIIALLMAVCLLAVCFAGCSPAESQPTESTVSTESTVETPKLSWKISDNLPVIEKEGNYTAYEAETGEGFETVGGYKTDDPNADVLAIEVYRWASEGKTLLEEAQEEIDTYYADQEDLAPVMCNYFIEPGDSEFAYYAAFDTEYFGKPTYYQAFIFQDGDDIVEYAYYTNTKKVAFGDTGAYIYLPVRMTEQQMSEEDIADGGILAYVDAGSTYPVSGNVEFPAVEVYTWAAEGNDIDAVIEYTKTTYGVTDENIVKYEWDGKPCFFAAYEIDGVCYEEYYMLDGETYISTAFSFAKDSQLATYTEAAIAAFAWSMGKE